MDTASILGLLYGRSIDALRQKGSASQSSGESEDGSVHAAETFNLSLTGKSLMNTYRFMIINIVQRQE